MPQLLRMRHHRSGFTLPEVLVAVLLLAVGIASLATTATALARVAGDARAMSAAALLAGSVLDSLRATPCRAVGGGSVSSGRATVRWSARPDSVTVHLMASLDLQRGSVVATSLVETMLPCDR